MPVNNWDEILNSSSGSAGTKTTDWNKELGVKKEEKKKSLAETIATMPIVSKGLDLATAIMPPEDWQRLQDEQLAFGRSAADFQGALGRTISMQSKPEDASTIATALSGVMEPLARIYQGGIQAPISNIVKQKRETGKIDVGQVAQATARGFLHPEDITPISREAIPLTQSELTGPWTNLIPRAIVEGAETALIYSNPAKILSEANAASKIAAQKSLLNKAAEGAKQVLMKNGMSEEQAVAKLMEPGAQEALLNVKDPRSGVTIRDYVTGNKFVKMYSGSNPEINPKALGDVAGKELPAGGAKALGAKVFFRGGPDSAMPKGMTAQDIINYEKKELGNKDITVEKGIDLKSIKSDNLQWVTLDAKSAKEYGKVIKQEYPNAKIIARDSQSGVLIDTSKLSTPTGEGQKTPILTKFPLVDENNNPVVKWSYHTETGDVRPVPGLGNHYDVLPPGKEGDKYVRGFTDLPNKTIGTRVWGSWDTGIDKVSSYKKQYEAALAFAKQHPNTEYWIKDIDNSDLPRGEGFYADTFPQARKIPINNKIGIMFEHITPSDNHLNYEQKLNLSDAISNVLYDRNGNHKVLDIFGATGKVAYPYGGGWEGKLSPGARATIYGDNKIFSGFTPQHKIDKVAAGLGYVLRQDAIATSRPNLNGRYNAIRLEPPRDLTNTELESLTKSLNSRGILGFYNTPNGIVYVDYFNNLTKEKLYDIFNSAVKEATPDNLGIKTIQYKDTGKLIEGGKDGISYTTHFNKRGIQGRKLDNLRMEVDKARDRFYKSGTGLAPTADKPHFGQVSQTTKVKSTKGNLIFKKGDTLAAYPRGKSIFVKDGSQGLISKKEFGNLAQFVDFNAPPKGGGLPFKPEKNSELKQSYINLSKYPEDVQAAIKKIISTQPESLQRKVITHAEIEAMANKLKSEPIAEYMLKFTPGQLAAEWLHTKQGEVSLIRNALKADLNGEFKQKLLNVLAEKQLSKAGKIGTEIGRALSSGNINVQEQLGLATEINDKIEQVKKSDLLAEEDKKAYIDNLVALRKLSLSKEFNPTWFDKGYESWVNNILSGPWTHTVNMVSNAMFAGIKPLEKAVYAAVDLPMSWWTGKRTHTLHEIVGQMEGMGRALRGEKLPLPIAEGSKIENSNRPGAIKGLKGKIIRGEAWLKLPNGKMIPTNLGTAQLRTEDNYSKKLIGWMELCGKAEMTARSEGLTGNALIQRKNELIFNPTGEMKDQVLQEQLYRTFQDSTFLGEWAKRMPQFGLRWIVPFRNTPASILTKAFERTPFGWGKVGLKFGRQFVGKKTPYGQGEAAADIGNAMIGTAIFFGLLYAYKKGRVTGSAPKQGAPRDKFFAEGKQPNSMLVGGKWVPYDRLEPYGTAMQYMVNTIQMFDQSEKESSFDKLTESMYGLSTSIADKTFLSGLTSATEAVVDPQRYGEQFAAKMVGGFVPQAGLLRNVAQATDLRVREPGNMAERITTNIPGLSQMVTQKRNAFGEKQSRKPIGGTRVLPYQVTRAGESTPLQQELNRLDINLERIPKSYRTLKLSPKEVNTVAKVEGGLIKEQLNNVISDPAYADLSDTDKQKQVERVINNIKHEVRGVFLQDKIVGDLKKQLKGKSPERQNQIKERYFGKLEKAKLIPKKVEESPVAASATNWDEIIK